MLRELYGFLMGSRKKDKPKEPPVKNKNLASAVDAAKNRDVQKSETVNRQLETPRFNAHLRTRPMQNGDLHILTIEGVEYDLWFRKHWTVQHRFDEDLQERVYQIGERKYQGRKTFTEEEIEIISNNEKIWKDIHHSMVLAVYESVPTFDSGDREWDSMKVDYLIFDGKHIDIVQCHYGYKMGSITVYEQLFAADQDLRSRIERLHYPVEDIKWLDYSLWR